MDDWVLRAMQRWPNVPALFGWLALDRRGRWLIRDEIITHPLIIQTIHRNYARDEHGRWFFQNGPQRGYIRLAYTPFVLRTSEDGAQLLTHNGLLVSAPRAAYLDDEGTIILDTEHGPGQIVSTDLEWALDRLRGPSGAVAEDDIADAMVLTSGSTTSIALEYGDRSLSLVRIDGTEVATHFRFVLDPQPREGERTSSGAPD